MPTKRTGAGNYPGPCSKSLQFSLLVRCCCADYVDAKPPVVRYRADVLGYGSPARRLLARNTERIGRYDCDVGWDLVFPRAFRTQDPGTASDGHLAVAAFRDEALVLIIRHALDHEYLCAAYAGRPSNTLRAVGSWLTLRACQSPGSGRTLRTFGAPGTLRPLRTLRTLIAHKALRTLGSRRSLRTLFALDSCGTLRTGVTLLATLSDRTLRAGRALGSLRPWRAARIARVALLTRVALHTLRTLRTLRTPGPRVARVALRASGIALLTLRAFRTLRASGAG